ncbi:MAG TPA: Rne/Rng family ribonuclease [Sporichthyaceae bacterium]|nr:Rne/Rng family ribonuclease [Sporichthyaceae bacterium]
MLEDEPTEQSDTAEPQSAEAAAKPARRRRAAGRPAGPPAEPFDVPARRSVASAAAATEPETPDTEPGRAAAEPDGDAAAAAPRARRTRKKVAEAEPGPAEAHSAPEPPEAPARSRRTRTRVAPTTGVDGPIQDDEPAPVAFAASVLFQAPTMAAPPAPRRRRSATAVEPVTTPEAAAAAEEDAAVPADAPRSRRRTRRPASAVADPPAADLDEVEEADEADDTDPDAEDSDETTAARRRRRRRGGRGRRGRGTPLDSVAGEIGEIGVQTPAEPEAEADDDAEDAVGEGVGTRRRRRRRRRGEDSGAAADDPEHTVTRVRTPPRVEGEVTAVRGSTRLEAKKQRRREGREAGRRRAPILSEAEFLARREAVDRVMVIRQGRERMQIAVLEDGVLVEHYVNRASTSSLMGDIFLARVQNVLPSMEAAFVDIGKGRNAVLYAGEVNFDGLEGQPKRIEHVLKSGQSILVQVTKDPLGHKGARLTSQISLPGRYLVYVPENSMTGISRKLPDTERNRLKSILRQVLPDDAGVIVRTAAEGASEAELRHDVERLAAQWEQVQARAKTATAPALLLGEPDLMIRVVRDVFNEDFHSLVVSGDEAWAEISDYVTRVAPDLSSRLTRWVEPGDVFAAHRVDEQILKALDRKVWLPSGGSLVIDRTEAMTVIDVNTGKFTGSGGNLEETVTRNNLEAAEEIVRQLRLRDVGGIIVIDFIDMVLESNRELVLRRLVECLGRDRTKHQVAEVTSLGLVQMTRKRIGQGLLEAFSEPCEHCSGRGIMVRTDEPSRGRVPKPTPPMPGVVVRNGHGTGEATEPLAAESAEAGDRPARTGRRRRGRGGGDPNAGTHSDITNTDITNTDITHQLVTASPDDPDAMVEPVVVHPRDGMQAEPAPDGDTPPRRSRRRRSEAVAEVEAPV